jgi:hypothetical protein
MEGDIELLAVLDGVMLWEAATLGVGEGEVKMGRQAVVNVSGSEYCSAAELHGAA